MELMQDAGRKRSVDPQEVFDLLDAHHDIYTWEEIGFHIRKRGKVIARRMRQLGVYREINRRLKRRKHRQIERTQVLYLFYLSFLAECLERTPTTQDIDEFEGDDGPSHAVYFYHFGSLQEAQRTIGCEPNPHGDVRRIIEHKAVVTHAA